MPSMAKSGKTGVKLWEFDVGSGDAINVYSSPAIGSDGTVYVGSYDKKLYAFRNLTAPKAPQKVLGRCLDIMPNTLDWTCKVD